MGKSEWTGTPYSYVNELVQVVMEGARGVLGKGFVGMYLDGSLANGGFDQGSDIDFVVVTEEDVAGELFLALREMHDQISVLDTPWAIQLEGSYISRQGIRRYDPGHFLFPNLERGQGERLKMAEHDPIWAVHRWVLRERGIIVTGPDPRTLVDPVSAEELRAGSRHTLNTWATRLAEHPEQMSSKGYQSYVVLTLCRILYTLELGEVASKQVAASRAQERLGQRFGGLIEQALRERLQSDGAPDAETLRKTVEMIGFVQAIAQNRA
ncbi:MAG: DUF4111 domain-containing protein [Anaerolineaceae bacterium]|nr:DUF4111 domain-containing protein [Anaerolineaceae bacterium]